MAVNLDALNITKILHGLQSCSKKRILSCLSSMNELDLKHLIISALKQSQPQSPDIIWNDHLDNTFRYTTHIKQFFAKKKKKNNTPNRNNLFLLLPESIGAYIISFNTMNDRIKYELISKDLYLFCQNPTAKYHLIIDHKFVKALYYNKIDIKKYFNAQYLEIKYVFKDTQYETFEDKYYSLISKIISTSQLLNTIKYELEYHKFKSKILQTTAGEKWYGHEGHILEWMNGIKNNKNSKENVFNSVNKLIYIPSQFRMDQICNVRKMEKWRHNYNKFCQYFPNLISFAMPKCKLYSKTDGHMWLGGTFQGVCNNYDDKDCEWNVFKQNNYINKLEKIECDLIPYSASKLSYFDSYDSEIRHINIKNNPLSNFYKFNQLKILKLKLPIFNNCKNYYGQIINCNGISIINKQCINLNEISLEFMNNNINDFNGQNNETKYNSNNIMDEICKYILLYCKNITKYKLIINNTQNNQIFNHLIGYYDRIKYFHTDFPLIINQKQIRMISLKQLTITLYKNKETIQSKLRDLNGFPNLETFKCIYINKSNGKWVNLHNDITKFIDYISQQKCNKKLKYIGLYHKIKRKNNKKKKFQRTEYFNLEQSVKISSSELLCKSIISLLTINNNFNLKSIEICPIALKEKELKYLYFWFSNGNGGFDSNNYAKKQNTILTDIYCSQ